MPQQPEFTWRALNAALLIAVAAALLLAGWLAVVDGERETGRHAEQIRRIATAGLEGGKGSPKRLQELLASSAGAGLFSDLEIHGRAGTLVTVRYPDSPAGRLDRWLPKAGPAPIELPLDAKGAFVLKLTPVSHSVRLLTAAPRGLAAAALVVLIANAAAWLLRRRTAEYRIPPRSPAAALSAEAFGDRPSGAERSASLLSADELPVAVLRCESDGRVSQMNQAAYALLGRRPDAQHSPSLLEWVAPWRRADFCQALAEVRRPYAGPLPDTEVLAARGGFRPVTLDIARNSGAAGADLFVLRDAGEKKALRDELALHHRLLGALPYGLALLDAGSDGEIRYCNDAFRALLHLPEAAAGSRGIPLLGHLAYEATPTDAERLRPLLERPDSSAIVFDWTAGESGRRSLQLRLFPVDTASEAAETLLACVVLDCTDDMDFHRRLEQELTRCRMMMEAMPLGFCIVDRDGIVRGLNPALGKLVARPEEQIVGAPVTEWLACDASPTVSRGSYDIKTTGRTAALSPVILPAPDGGRDYVYFLDDITAFKRQADTDGAELDRLQRTLDGIAEGVLTTNAGGFIQYINPYGQRLTGLNERQYKGMSLSQVVQLIDEVRREPIADPAVRAMRVGKTVRFRHDIVLVREGRQELAVEITATPLQDGHGKVVGCVIVLKDVSEQRSLTRQMAMRATRDPLTGLVNRRELLSLLETLQSELEERSRECWICYMDLDRFKAVNDSCGHQAGDELLRQISRLMQECLRLNDVLARIGGDEFCVVLRDTTRQAALFTAEKIREAVKHFRFAWDGKYFEVGVSIGVYRLLPGVGVEEAIAAADQACYIAKERGRDLVHAASGPEQPAEKSTPADWPARLAKAMEHDYFRLLCRDARYLQRDDGAVTAYREILLRLEEPGEIPVVAASFMPRAQRMNLVPMIERHAIGTLLSVIRTASAADEVFALQLSPATAAEAGFARFLSEQSDLYGVQPSRLCFEITEDDAVANFTLFQKLMHELQGLGYRFCLSHFGGGVSSFAYIRNLPLAYLKIDSSLTRRVGTDPVDEEIIRAIQRIADRLQIKTFAQDLDSEATLGVLRDLGIHYVQGPVVAEPVPLK